MLKRLFPWISRGLLIPALLTLGSPPLGAQGAAIAIVANKTTAAAGVSSGEFRSFLLGQKETWPNGQKVTVVLLPTASPESKLVLKQICNMSDGDFKRYFLQMAFQGKRVPLPRAVASAAAVKAVVAATPGAFGIIPMAEVDASVHILPLDGIAPGAPGYKLAAAE